jgi:hypothetical protein
MNLAIYMVEPYIAQVNDGRYDELGWTMHLWYTV